MIDSPPADDAPLRPAVVRRLHAWQGVVVLTLTGNALLAGFGWRGAAVASTLLLLAMAALLATTPPDAVRLPRGRSERIIAIGFALVAAIATRGHLQAILVAIALLLAGVAGLALARRTNVSPWWVAVLLWQPALLTLVARFA